MQPSGIGHLENLPIIDTADTDNDHAVGSVVGFGMWCCWRKVIALDRKNILLWAKDCATVWLAYDRWMYCECNRDNCFPHLMVSS